jgi:hypothetical protein
MHRLPAAAALLMAVFAIWPASAMAQIEQVTISVGGMT